MEKITCLGQPNCYRLSNDTVELVVTTGVGPRIIRYAFAGQENILAEVPDSVINTAAGTFKAWGGHRLWAAPEANPRTYAPENEPVEYKIEGERKITLRAPAESFTGLQKEIAVALEETGPMVQVHHRITNLNLWSIELAPWAITIMNGGGEAILPQEPYRSWDDYLLPARSLAIWHYTDLSDRRFTIGAKYIRVRTDESLKNPQKIGILNKQGWAGYYRNGTLFIKRFPFVEGATYPDYNSNNEVYTSGSFIELESIAPLQKLEPGASAEHIESWFLYDGVEPGGTEAAFDESISRFVVAIEESGV